MFSRQRQARERTGHLQHLLCEGDGLSRLHGEPRDLAIEVHAHSALVWRHVDREVRRLLQLGERD